MRRTAVEMATLAALLLGGALAYGQQAAPREAAPPAVAAPAAAADKPKDSPAKSKLEEMLQKALQDNPDLRLAAAKVAEADAELNRARLLVVQKVGAAYQAVEAQKAAVESKAAELEETKVRIMAGHASQGTLRATEQELLDAKAKLAALETEMPYLIGKQPANNAALPAGAFGGGLGALGGGGLGTLGGGLGAFGGGAGAFGGLDPNADSDAPKPVPVLGRTAERIRAALDKPFSLELKKAKLSTVIAEVSAAFRHANPGLLIKCNITPEQLGNPPLENVKFEEMPFGAVLVWIEDSVPASGIVVRDYGLVIDLNAELPLGAPTLHDFWKSGEAGEKAPAKEQSSNPPAKHVEGVVQAVDANGLVSISIGSDDGIAKGTILDVFRLNAPPANPSTYLGQIKVVAATATRAVGQPLAKASPMKAGDHVSNRIVGD